MIKILLYGTITSIGLSIIEFMVWFFYLFYVLQQKDIKTNFKKSMLVCIPFKAGIPYYVYKYGLEDVEIFRAIGIRIWSSLVKNIDSIRVRYTLLHYMFCVIETITGIILGIVSLIVTPIILIVGILVLTIILNIIEPAYNLYENKKPRIRSLLHYVGDCMLLGLDSLPKLKIFY